MSEVLDYLASKNIDYRVAPNSNVRTTCFFHEEEGEPHTGRLYIRVDDNDEVPGLFFCHVCEEKGSLNKIKKHFGDPIDNETIPQGKKVQIFQAAADYYAANLINDQKAMDYLLDERNLSPETINELQLGAADGDLLNHLLLMEFTKEDIRATGLVNGQDEDFFQQGTVTMPFFRQNSCIQIRGRVLEATKNKYRTPPGQKAILYNTDVMLDANEVILTEGEFDAMLLHDLGYKAIGVPGVRSFKEDWGRFFSEMKRVYICFDTDEPGRDGAARLAAYLGPKARILELPRPQTGQDTDVSDYLKSVDYDPAGFDLLLKKARSGSLVRVEDAYEAWLDREGNPDLQGLLTGYAKLDSIIRPGLLPGQLAVFLARTGSGKSQPIVTEMPTPNGHRKLGDLTVGDHVFGSDGKPTKVTGVFDRGVLDTYRVHFSDHSYLDVGADHIWTVEYQSGKRHTDRKRKNLTTSELMQEDLKKGRAWRYRIPLCGQVEYEARTVLFDPYVMGAILANGSFGGTSLVLTTNDQEISDRVGLYESLRDITSAGYANRFIIHDGKRRLRELGLDGLKSADKFIPDVYLTGSVDQRISLLQGLMDGDGSSRANQGRSATLYHTTSERLADGVIELVNSLGGTASKNFKWRKGCHEGVVNIMLPPEVQQFFSSRKNLTVDKSYKTGPRRAIVRIEHVGQDEHRCISVEAEDSLYLGNGSYVVTHNTIQMVNFMHRMIKVKPDLKCLFLSLEQTANEWYERARRVQGFYDPNLHPDFGLNEETIGFYRDNLLMVEKNRVSMEEFRATIRQAKEEFESDLDLIVVDYLGYWSRAFKGEPYVRTSDAVMALKEVAKEESVAILSPHQVNRGSKPGTKIQTSDSRESGVVEETADFLLAIEKPLEEMNAQTAQGVLNLGILKSRHGGVGATVEMIFAPTSLAVVPQIDEIYGGEFYRQAQNEVKWRAQGEYNFEKVLERHSSGSNALLTSDQEEMEYEEF